MIVKGSSFPKEALLETFSESETLCYRILRRIFKEKDLMGSRFFFFPKNVSLNIFFHTTTLKHHEPHLVCVWVSL